MDNDSDTKYYVEYVAAQEASTRYGGCNPPGAQQAPSLMDAHYSTVDDDDESTGDPSGEPFEVQEVDDD